MTRRDLRREATKTSVLAAAERVFLREGFVGSTIKMIADEAGVSPGTVLNAAPTKAALLVTILRGESDQIAEAVDQMAGALSGSATHRLEALLQTILDGVLRRGELFAAAMGHSWLEGSAEYQTALDALANFWDPVKALITDAITSGEFNRELDPQGVFFLLRDSVAGAVRESVREAGLNPRAVLQTRLNVLFLGLRAPAAA